MKKYKVHGIAFCPVEVAVEVEAENERAALKMARAKARENPRRYVVPGSEDPDHWHDWQPNVEWA